MTDRSPSPVLPPFSQNRVGLPSYVAPLSISAAALLLAWPALYNRFPFLYPDSINYLADGRQVMQAILHLRHGTLGWMRSPLYSLGIFAVHWGRTPWPVVILHALLVAWLLWLVTRSLVSRSLASRSLASRSLASRWLIVGYLAIVAALSLLTGLSWVVSWVLPDVLGAALYLSMYLLVFARNTLSRTEAAALAVVLVWSANSHVTHLMLAAFLCAWLGLLIPLWPAVMGPRAGFVARIAALVGLAVALQIAANGILTRSWSLTGKHPPFLTARLLGDGPARTLLQQRCPQLNLTLCQFAGNLPTDSDEFLWGPGIMTEATPAQADQIGREEMPLLKATLRAYPWQQARISLHNFRTQLTYYDIEGFGNNTWAEQTLKQIMPGADVPYHRTRQAHDSVASDPFSDIQDRTVPVAVLVLCITLPFCWRRSQTRVLGLAVIVVPVVIVNAFVTGVLSVADSRYQVRVMWLLPLLAMLTLLQLAADWRPARPMDTA